MSRPRRRRRRPAPTRRAGPRFLLSLPTLGTVETLYVVDFLEQLISALWLVYGDDLADVAARIGVDTPRPRGARWAGRPADPTDPDPDF
jgi:hypothetical protein